MKLVVRSKACRRTGLPASFPLRDSHGVLVSADRRKLPDRRKDQYGIDDLRVILSKMSSD
jgi:hypothetical protein